MTTPINPINVLKWALNKVKEVKEDKEAKAPIDTKKTQTKENENTYEIPHLKIHGNNGVTLQKTHEVPATKTDKTQVDTTERTKTFSENPSALAGEKQPCAYGGDPVNMSTGNFIYQKADLEIPGASPLSFERFYNSLGGNTSVLGKNWTHNFNIFLTEKEGAIVVLFEDGRSETYALQQDGSYLAPSGKFNALVKNQLPGLHRFVLTTPDKRTYAFNDQGLLVEMGDANGNTTALVYKKGLLSYVGNQSGQLYMSYTSKGLLSEVRDHSERRVVYSYKNGYLASVRLPNGALHQYTYDHAGNLQTISNPAQTVSIRNEYDTMGRVARQYFADGGTIDMAYAGFVTTTSEQNGNKIQYVSDEKFRTVEVRYEDSTERFEYSDDDKPILHQDRNGNIRRYAYDSRGNVVQSTNPLGYTTSVAYDDMGNPTSIFQADASLLSFSYDAQGNLLKAVDPLQRTTEFAYSPEGRLGQVRMPDGSCVRYVHDVRGNVTEMVNAQGYVTKYVYDMLNRVIETHSPEGHVTCFAYNSQNNIVKVTNAKGDSRHYEYNALGKVSKLIDFGGAETRYIYNKLGKLQEILDAHGNSTHFEYDTMGKLRRLTNPLGESTQYVYNLLGHLVFVVDAEKNVTTFEHDAKGNLIAATSATGAKTYFSYDAMDRVVHVEEPDNATTHFEYDAVGNLTKITDAIGNVKTQHFDLAGQLVKTVDALGNATQFAYSPLGLLETTTDAAGQTMRNTYAPGGQLKSVCLPSGESETFSYDKNGNIVQVTDALGHATLLCYDALDRVVEIKNPLGHSKHFAYDAAGNIAEVTDENGNKTCFLYSLLGELLQVTDALGHTTRYKYDKARRLSKMEQYKLVDKTYAHVKQIEAQETSWKRNRKGEVIEKRTPLGEICHYAYDGVGNLISKTDEDGLKTLYEYNLANKLSKVVYDDGKTVELSYNPLKVLTELRDWLGTTRIQTDALGRIEKVTDFEGKRVQYKWDALGRRQELVYPDESKVDYAWNALGQLESVTSSSGITQFHYDRQGRLSKRTMPGKLTTHYEMDPLGRLASLTHVKGNDVVDRFRYQYDAVGNITHIDKHRAGLEDDSGRFSYAYDAIGRLVEATCGQKRKQYGYDSFGNRVFSLQNGIETRHSYNAKNQLVRSQEGEMTREYSYDQRGNLTQLLENGNLKANYVFDATNRMVEAVTAKRGRAEYVYNGFLKRVKRLEEVGTGEQNLLHSPEEPTREIRYILDMTLPYNDLLATEGAQIQRYVWGNSLLSAEGSENFHYLQDHLGSPVRLVGKDKNTPLAYDEFGVPLVDGQQKLNNPFGFTGYQTDEVSGLCYAQARYYNPTSARFISEDFARDGVNYYAYCYNNPVRFVDRNGLWGENVHKDLTTTWAKSKDVGMSHDIAAKIGNYNYQTDTKYDPVDSDINKKRYHFNCNKSKDGSDSRSLIAYKNKEKAIKLWNKGGKENQEKALELLGEGLHALQDIEAHGNNGVGSLIKSHNGWQFIFSGFNKEIQDDIEYDWTSDKRKTVTKSDKPYGEGDRIKKTESDTKAYLKEFMERTGMEPISEPKVSKAKCNSV